MMLKVYSKNSSLLVVIYNKEKEESNTLKSILNFSFFDSDLCILNNGPISINMDGEVGSLLYKKFDNVVLINHIENMPLSVAYNNFINTHIDSKKFILLDDDTTLTQSFVDKINEIDNCFDLELPRITSINDNIIHYPVSVTDNSAILSNCDLDISQTISIGSGLVISKNLVMKFRKHGLNVFDEHFALYGVDFSFFRRMWFLQAKGEFFKVKCSCVLYHSLSRVEGDVSQGRLRERLFDIALQARHYPSKDHYILLFKVLMKYALLCKMTTLKLLIETYFSGFHPRCLKYKK